MTDLVGVRALLWLERKFPESFANGSHSADTHVKGTCTEIEDEKGDAGMEVRRENGQKAGPIRYSD